MLGSLTTTVISPPQIINESVNFILHFLTHFVAGESGGFVSRDDDIWNEDRQAAVIALIVASLGVSIIRFATSCCL